MFGLGRNEIGWWGNGGGGPPVVTEWLLDGNTNGSEKYIGTNDNYDLPVTVNGIEAFRFIAATGEIQYPLGASLGYVLTSDASGIATWQSVGGSGTINQLDDVISQTNTPAVGPATGDRYLIGVAPTGVWVGHANEIAEWDGLDWVYTIPVLDDYVYATSTLTTRRFNGTIWQILPGVAILQNGNTLGAAGARIGTNDNNPVWLKQNNTLRFRLDSVSIRTALSMYVGIPGMTSAPTARLHVRGAGATSATYAFKSDNSAVAPLLYVRNDGHTKITSTIESQGSGNPILEVESSTGGTRTFFNAAAGFANIMQWRTDGSLKGQIYVSPSSEMLLYSGMWQFTDFSNNKRLNISTGGDILIGDPANLYSASARLHVMGAGATSATYGLKVSNNVNSDMFYVRNDGLVSSTLGYSIGTSLFVSNLASVTNTFIGALAGQTAIVGSERSVAVGYAALQNHGANAASTAVGYLSLNASTNTRNTAVGVNSALALSSGNAVTAIGDGALAQMTTEGEATALGFLAGFGVTAGLGCVFLGSRAGYAGDQVAGVQFSIALGYGATTTINNQLVIGNQGAGSQITDFAIGWGAHVTTGFQANVTTTIRPTNIATGVSNQANGYHICIAGGMSTGTGAGSDILFKVSSAGGAGSAQNALAEVMRISNTQTVGIGITVPLAKLHIKGAGSTSANYALGVYNSSDTNMLNVRNDGTVGINTIDWTNGYGGLTNKLAVRGANGDTGYHTLGYFENSINPTINNGNYNRALTSSIVKYGAFNTGQITGALNTADDQGSGNITDMFAMNSYLLSRGSGTITNAITNYSDKQVQSGTITTLASFVADTTQLSGGAVTDLIGLLVKTPTNVSGGTRTNTYGVLVQENTTGTNDYGFVCSGVQSNGLGTATPSADALLELVSTSKAFLIMRMTAAQASAITPANGMGLYVTTTDATFLTVGFWKYEGGAWLPW